VNVVGLKSPAQNHEQTRQVSAVDVASSLFRVPHSEQVNTPSSALGCASASMLSLEIEKSKFQIMSKNQGGKRKLIIFLPGVHRRDRGTGSMKMARAGEGFPDERTPILDRGFPMSAHLSSTEGLRWICVGETVYPYAKQFGSWTAWKYLYCFFRFHCCFCFQ
jgi:hypothetical protein